MPTTKAQQRAVAKYMKANYDEMKIRLPKGQKQAVESYARAKGESINGLVNGLLRVEMGLSKNEWKAIQTEPGEE